MAGRPLFTALPKVRDVGKWAQWLAREILQHTPDGTVKTDERGVLTVLAVTPEWVASEIQGAVISTRTCTGCAHRLRRGTCGQPALAGLDPPPGLAPGADWFGIRWPPAGHGATCPAFEATQRETK